MLSLSNLCLSSRDSHLSPSSSTCSKGLILACVWGFQTVDAYSRIGRTIVLYTMSFIGGLHSLRFLLRKPTVLLALATVYMSIPWQVVLDSHSQIPADIYHIKDMSMKLILCSTLFFLVEILITTHLVGLKLICQVCSHSLSAERSLWRRALSLSPANNLVCEDCIDSGRSFMKHKNRRGPSTMPCGQLWDSWHDLSCVRFNTIQEHLLPSMGRKDWIHFLV